MGQCCCNNTVGGACCCHEFDVVFLIPWAPTSFFYGWGCSSLIGGKGITWTRDRIENILDTYKHSKTCNWGLVVYSATCSFPCESGDPGFVECFDPFIPYTGTCSGYGDENRFSFGSGFEVIVPLTNDDQLIRDGLDCLDSSYLRPTTGICGPCYKYNNEINCPTGFYPDDALITCQWLPAVKHIADNWTGIWDRTWPPNPTGTGIDGLCYPKDFYQGMTSPPLSGETQKIQSCQTPVGRGQRNLLYHFAACESSEDFTTLGAAKTALNDAGIYYLGEGPGPCMIKDFLTGGSYLYSGLAYQQCELATSTCGWCFGCDLFEESGVGGLPPEADVNSIIRTRCSHTGTVDDLLCCILCRKHPAECSVVTPGCKVCCSTPGALLVEIDTPPTNNFCVNCASVGGTYIVSRLDAANTGECCYRGIYDDVACYDSMQIDVCYYIDNGSGEMSVSIIGNSVTPGDGWGSVTGLNRVIDCAACFDNAGWNCCDPPGPLKGEYGFPAPAWDRCNWTNVRVNVSVGDEAGACPPPHPPKPGRDPGICGPG
jgi:hypothetical protein